MVIGILGLQLCMIFYVKNNGITSVKRQIQLLDYQLLLLLLLCDVPEVFTSTTVFMECGGKTSSVGQESYILEAHYKIPYYVLLTTLIRVIYIYILLR